MLVSFPPPGSAVARQRMNKAAPNYTSPASTTTYAIVPNWASDSTYPSTIASNKLTVANAGAPASTKVAAHLEPTTTAAGGTFYARLMVDGVQVDLKSVVLVASTPVPVNLSGFAMLSSGSTVWVEVRTQTGGSFQQGILAGSAVNYVEVGGP